MTILNEVEYTHRTRLWSDIRQYVGKGYYIHFGLTPKMGVRPMGKFHSDPAGVYFYNLDWLAKHQRFINGEQFGVNWPYWTIVERHADDRGIILSRLTWDDLTQLATNNHWPKFEDWEREGYEKMRAPHNSPAGMFWDYIKACSPMMRGGKDLPTQNAALKGVSFVEDDGLGIIHGSEPYQMVMFDSRIIRVVASGNQGKPEDDKLMNGQRFAFVELLKTLRGEYGGEIKWMRKIPSLAFEHKGASFKLTWVTSSWDASLRLDVRWGRARKTFSFKEGDFVRQTMDEVLKFFHGIIAKFSALAAAKKDIFFKPLLSEKEARDGVRSLTGDGFVEETEINNDHHEMTVHAEKTIPLGETKTSMLVLVHCINATDKIRYSVTIKIGSYAIASARVTEEPSRVADTLKTNLEKSLEDVHPNSDAYGKKFYYPEDYQAFIGMVADLSGIKSLAADFPDEVAAWRDYKNKNELYRDISRIY